MADVSSRVEHSGYVRYRRSLPAVSFTSVRLWTHIGDYHLLYCWIPAWNPPASIGRCVAAVVIAMCRRHVCAPSGAENGTERPETTIYLSQMFFGRISLTQGPTLMPQVRIWLERALVQASNSPQFDNTQRFRQTISHAFFISTELCVLCRTSIPEDLALSAVGESIAAG
jgi:hypothetical protein